MAADPDGPGLAEGELRAALGHFASGVVVVAGGPAEHPAGLTCQSFFSLSLDPPLVAFAPSRSSRSWPLIAGSRSCTLNVLAADQEPLARAFARSGSDKFAGIGWSEGATGAPRLQGALAWIDCHLESALDGGDHHLVLARVVAVEANPGRPLVFYRGGFGGFAP